MFCKNCGASLADDARFCEGCGTPIKKEEVPASVTEDAVGENVIAQVADALEGTTENAFENADASFGEATEAPKKKSPGKIIAIIAVIIVALAAISGIFGGNTSSDPESIYHEVNINNSGYFDYDDSRLYFVAKYNEDDDETSVYSTDYNGVNKQKISSDGDIIRIQVVGDTIYFEKSSDSKYSLHSMNLDGSNEQKLVSLDGIASKYTVVGGKIYYVSENKLHVCDTTGGNDTVLIENAEEFSVNGNTSIYYTTEDDILCIYNMKDQTSNELYEVEAISHLANNGTNLYFTSTKGLCTYALDGSSTVQVLISDSSMGRYAFLGDTIYYVHTFDTDEIDTFANYISGDSDTTTAKLFLIGMGYVYSANKIGGVGVEAETEQSFAFALFNYPDGIYRKMSAFSKDIEPVVFE